MNERECTSLRRESTFQSLYSVLHRVPGRKSEVRRSGGSLPDLQRLVGRAVRPAQRFE